MPIRIIRARCLVVGLALAGCPGSDRATGNTASTPRAVAAKARAATSAAPARNRRSPPIAAAQPAAASTPDISRHDYDLVTNLPLAHVIHDGIVADASSVGFDKYIRDYGRSRDWRVGLQEDGLTVALTPPRQARLWIPIGSELVAPDAKLLLEVRCKPIGSDALALFVNGKQVGESQLQPGWQTVRLPLPAGLVKPGVARVRLYFGRARTHAGTRTSAAIRYVRLARLTTPALPEDETAAARALGRSNSSQRLVLPGRGTGLDYYITPTAGTRLRSAVSGAAVEVWTQVDGSAPAKLTTASGKAIDVPLDPLAGQAIRLMLRSGADATDTSTLTAPRISSRAAGASATATAGAGKPAAPARVVFWLVDALRADKLDFYGERGSQRPKVKTPNLSRIAAAGTVFDPFWVTSNESKASHASYFTGTYPAIHRVLTRAAKLRDSHLTLAEAFRQAGYRTAAFVSNGFISRRWNYDQGFEHLHNFIREGTANDARAVVDKAIPWIDRHKDERFYLYLGTADTHVSYRVHPRFIKQYDKAPYSGRYRRFLSGKELGRIKQSRSKPPERERQRIEAIYENELAFNDHHFGRLVAHLQKLGIDDQTLFIINSDHGEEFWEHGSCGHGHSLHGDQISVPFVLQMKGVFPAARVTSGHDGVDLVPTVLALLGRQPADEVQGESLLPYLPAATSPRATYPRAMVASNEADSYALQVGPAKAIARSSSSVRIYDVSRDPVERSNVYKERPILAQCALDPLSLFVPRAKRWRKSRWGVPNNLSAPLVDR